MIGIHVGKADAVTQIQIALDQPSDYHIFSLSKPNRWVIDLEQGGSIKIPLAKIRLPETVKAVRSGHPTPHILRLVIETDNILKLISSPKITSSKVLEFNFKSTQPKNTLSNGMSTAAKVVPRTEISAVFRKAPIVVVIDPGHGGKDPGAIGVHGTTEKQIVLAIAKRFAKLINQEPDMRAVLTRDGDYFVPLRNRLLLARKGKADLFIAIHADSYFNKSSHGTSVYALSQRGATSEATRWLARRENDSELGGVDLSELKDQSMLLRSVLIDLAQTATITDSLRLGNGLLKTLQTVTKLHYRHVEQAPFVVLKSPDIPSVLVETGFISNASEELRLRSEKYQEEIARALFEGIKQYSHRYLALAASKHVLV